MTLAQVAEWRGWIWIALTLVLAEVGGMWAIVAHAQGYTDLRCGEAIGQTTETKADIQGQLHEIRQDVRIIRQDIKTIMREGR